MAAEQFVTVLVEGVEDEPIVREVHHVVGMPAVQHEPIDVGDVVAEVQQHSGDLPQVFETRVAMVSVQLLHLDAEDQPSVIDEGHARVMSQLDPAYDDRDPLPSTRSSTPRRQASRSPALSRLWAHVISADSSRPRSLATRFGLCGVLIDARRPQLERIVAHSGQVEAGSVARSGDPRVRDLKSTARTDDSDIVAPGSLYTAANHAREARIEAQVGARPDVDPGRADGASTRYPCHLPWLRSAHGSGDHPHERDGVSPDVEDPATARGRVQQPPRGRGPGRNP